MHNIFTNYRKLGITDTYPGKKNSYRVDIIPDGGTTGFIVEFFSKEEFELIEEMQKLIDVIPQDQLRTIMKKIEDYGDRRSSDADDDNAMNNAGSDL